MAFSKVPTSTAAIKKLEEDSQVPEDPKQITNDQWKKVLSPEEYNVTRQSGTEAPFTNHFENHFVPGKYTCLCCGADLFVSDSKYHSGCGWPSFSKSVEQDKNIVRLPDDSIPGRHRTEVRCKSAMLT